jgi:hypothetical protein
MKSFQWTSVSNRISRVAVPKPTTNRRASARRLLNAASSTPTPPATYSTAAKRVFSGLSRSGICISAGTSRPVKPMPKPWIAANQR